MENEINKDGCYVVYKHTSPSNKVYIGITGQNPPEKRWANGHGYTDNQYFSRAIKKYSWDNILHEILYTDLTQQEAEQKEIELISYYKSADRNFGYNISLGGNSIGKHSEESKRKMSELSRGRIASEETRKKLSESHKNISDKTRTKMSESHKKEVYQFDKNGRLLKKYNSILEASVDTNVAGCSIVNCCQGRYKTAGGYIWKYENDYLDSDCLLWHNNDNKLSVCQYSKSGEFIFAYDSISEASLKTGADKSSIVRCCTHRQKTAKGYIWRYLTDELTAEDIEWCNNIGKDDTKRAVIQYSVDGKFIKAFDSLIAVKKELGFDDSAIIRCCKRKQKLSYGYIWRYVDDENNEFGKAV